MQSFNLIKNSSTEDSKRHTIKNYKTAIDYVWQIPV